MNQTEQDLKHFIQQNIVYIKTMLDDIKASENKRQNAWAKAKREIFEKYSPKYKNRAHKLAQGIGEIGRAHMHDRSRQQFSDEEAETLKVMLDDIMVVLEEKHEIAE